MSAECYALTFLLHHLKACKFYEKLALRVAANGHVVDLYACHFDQTGLHEMRYFPNLTGGHIVMGDSFNTSLFKLTFQRVFAKDLRDQYQMGFNATFEVKTCRDLKVSGCVGPCVSANKKSSAVSENVIGVGGTTAWRVCHIDNQTTFAVYFDIANTPGVPIQQGTQAVIQFVTHYQHSSGQMRVRVTTCQRYWADAATNLPSIAAGFDQEAACVLMARYGVVRAQTDEGYVAFVGTLRARSVSLLCVAMRSLYHSVRTLRRMLDTPWKRSHGLLLVCLY